MMAIMMMMLLMMMMDVDEHGQHADQYRLNDDDDGYSMYSGVTSQTGK